MSIKPRDPLLAISRILLVISKGVTATAAVVLAAMAPLLFAFQDKVIARLASEGATPETIQAAIAVALIAAICAALGFFFFRHLTRIVGTVSEGDPFVPVNARRLSAMGWIALAVHVLSLPLMGLVHWIENVTENPRIIIDIPFSGILLALILFILARVFREGTRLRDEVEGTV